MAISQSVWSVRAGARPTLCPTYRVTSSVTWAQQACAPTVEITSFRSPGYAPSTRVGEAQPGLRCSPEECQVWWRSKDENEDDEDEEKIIELVIANACSFIGAFRVNLAGCYLQRETQVSGCSYLSFRHESTAEAVARHRRHPINWRTRSSYALLLLCKNWFCRFYDLMNNGF